MTLLFVLIPHFIEGTVMWDKTKIKSIAWAEAKIKASSIQDVTNERVAMFFT
jgi:hypothetical protein